MSDKPGARQFNVYYVYSMNYNIFNAQCHYNERLLTYDLQTITCINEINKEQYADNESFQK